MCLRDAESHGRFRLQGKESALEHVWGGGKCLLDILTCTLVELRHLCVVWDPFWEIFFSQNRKQKGWDGLGTAENTPMETTADLFYGTRDDVFKIQQKDTCNDHRYLRLILKSNTKWKFFELGKTKKSGQKQWEICMWFPFRSPKLPFIRKTKLS